jgi:hypothetical protein
MRSLDLVCLGVDGSVCKIWVRSWWFEQKSELVLAFYSRWTGALKIDLTSQPFGDVRIVWAFLTHIHRGPSAVESWCSSYVLERIATLYEFFCAAGAMPVSIPTRNLKTKSHFRIDRSIVEANERRKHFVSQPLPTYYSWDFYTIPHSLRANTDYCAILRRNQKQNLLKYLFR